MNVTVVGSMSAATSVNESCERPCLIFISRSSRTSAYPGTDIALGTHRLEGFFAPLVKSTYSLPKTALIPLLILWLGIGTATNVVAVMFSTLLPFVVYTYHGIQGVPKILVWSARAMGVPDHRLLWKVLLPGAQHAILTGLRIALGFSFVIAIAAEMIAAQTGIGKLMFIYGESGSYSYMFAAVTAIMILAYAADRVTVAASNRMLRWDDIENRLG